MTAGITDLLQEATAAADRGRRHEDPDAFSVAVDRLQRAASRLDRLDRRWVPVHLLLAYVLFRLHLCTGVPADLDESVRCARIAVEAAPAWDPSAAPGLMQLGRSLRVRYEATGAAEDLHAAHEAAAAAAPLLGPRDPARAEALADLGVVLRLRHQRTGASADLDAAVEQGRKAVAASLPGDPDLGSHLQNLATSVWLRFERDGAVTDLDETVQCADRAAAAMPGRDRQRPIALATLGVALRRRAERTGADADLERALVVLDEAFSGLARTNPVWPRMAAERAAARRARFDRRGTDRDLDHVIAASAGALAAMAPTAPDRPGVLTNLATARSIRFRRSGAATDLTAALAAIGAARAVQPAGRPQRPVLDTGLGTLLVERWQRHGDPADLDEAIRLHRQAARAGAGYPARPDALINLAVALRIRAERDGGNRDGGAREDSLREGGAREDGDGGATADGAGDRVGGGDDGRAGSGGGRAGGGLRDLHEAVYRAAESLDALEEHDPRRAAALAMSSAARLVRYGHTGDGADVTAAVEEATEAVAATPDRHPAAGLRRTVLGAALAARAARSGDPADVRAAVALWRSAATRRESSTRDRISAAWRWGNEAAAAGDWPLAADGYRAAVALLPRFAWRGAPDGDRRHRLAGWPGLAGDAAATLLRPDPAAAAAALDEPTAAVGALDGPAAAVGALEEGRSVLWSQLRELRTGWDGAGPTPPAALLDRLDQIRAALDTAPDPGGPATVRSDGMPQYEQPDRQAQDADRRMALAREWDDLVERARRLDGFADFLRPPSLEALLPAAAGGPVVIINVSRWRCDALIVRPAGVTVVELPDLHHDAVTEHVQAYLAAVGRGEGEGRDLAAGSGRGALEPALARCLAWMWDAFAGPVLDRLGCTGPPQGEDWPRVWWCPTGLLTLLPIHAAGHHRTGSDAVIDRVVSSYTPTLRALTEARADGPAAPGRLLFVGLADTPGLPELPHVVAERHSIAALLPGDGHTFLDGPGATRTAVLAQLDAHGWAHFSCHGDQDLDDPSQGGLHLHDGPVTVADLSGRRRRGELAYLSGCKTAVGGRALPDEAITLAAALHCTGYRHVIATLWSVGDRQAAQVAADVYAVLTRDGRLDARDAAVALHLAVRRLRTGHPGLPSVWTPFAHTGP